MAELHHCADELAWRQNRRADERLAGLLDHNALWHFGWRVHLDLVPICQRHFVTDVRRRREEIEVVLTLKAFAHDVHVQQPEEADTETKSESLRCLRFIDQRRVIELQLLKRITQVLEVVSADREQTTEDHRLHLAVSRQGLGRVIALGRDRVTDAQLGHVFDPVMMYPTSPALRFLTGVIFGPKNPMSSMFAFVGVWKVLIESPLVKTPSTTRTYAITPRYWSNSLSKINARGGASRSATGGGTLVTSASSIS